MLKKNKYESLKRSRFNFLLVSLLFYLNIKIKCKEIILYKFEQQCFVV